MSIDSKHTVLYVDDEEINLDLFAINFRKTFKVITCDNGFDALELVEKHNVKLIISDLMMPEMDGITLVKKIKETHKDTACFILTAYLDTSKIEVESGFIDEFVFKPWDVAEVNKMLGDAVERLSL